MAIVRVLLTWGFKHGVGNRCSSAVGWQWDGACGGVGQSGDGLTEPTESLIDHNSSNKEHNFWK